MGDTTDDIMSDSGRDNKHEEQDDVILFTPNLFQADDDLEESNIYHEIGGNPADQPVEHYSDEGNSILHLFVCLFV